jgi:cytochrome c oxidase subunit 2
MLEAKCTGKPRVGLLHFRKAKSKKAGADAVQKCWGLLFAAINIAAIALFAISPAMGWWLPRNIASYGADVDHLFNLILIATGFFFVLTQGILVYVMIRFAARDGLKARNIHGNTTLELVWTLVPASILIYIGFAQIPTWAKMKYIEIDTLFPVTYKGSNIESDLHVTVLGRQWEWRMRYPQGNIPAEPSVWADSGNLNDLHLVNELHAWKDARVKIHLKTQDVIHSFFLPNLRLKQDALPGKIMPMWFQPIEANVRYNPRTKVLEEIGSLPWEIACAELCGGNHYRMRGKLFIHESKQDYELWFADALKNQRLHESPRPQPIVAAGNGGQP